MGKLDALRLSMQSSYENRANWQELDASWTIAECLSRFATLRSALPMAMGEPPPLLRVVDLSGQSYTTCRTEIHSLQEYTVESTPSLVKMKGSELCYAFAPYKHKEDGNSTEWRPCIVRRHTQTQKPGQICHVSWAVTRSRVLSVPLPDCIPDVELSDDRILFINSPHALV